LLALASAGTFAYVFWYSMFDRPVQTIRSVGATLPELELFDDEGKRFDAPIRFCVDEDGRLARQLGIEHLGGVPFLMEPLGYDADSVLPTVVLTDPNRRIIFADLTDIYRVRPEPSVFLAALDAQG
jgi:hypothetical protein